MEEEAKRVPGLDCTMGAEKQNRKWIIRNGDVIDLPDLLFTQNRDYLITNTNNHVKAEQLADKVIALYFMPPFMFGSYTKYYTTLLIDVYNSLRTSNGFEVVFVPLHVDSHGETSLHASQTKSHRSFEEIFSCMPWTSIPFSDITSRKRLQTRFNVDCPVTMFVIDSEGIILQCHALDIVERYGALGYPFSDERVNFLKAEDDAIIKDPSLKTLLGSPHRDYVISNEGDKVPIHTLEDKVVALYFYEHETTEEDDTEELKMAYEELARTGKSFEVVLIYLHDTVRTYDCCTEESFWIDFKTMPWLALPFKDPNLKKLVRIFEYCQGGDEWYLEPNLVIFGPRGEFIEPYGLDILYRYKIPAYPFTRMIVAKLEAEKVQELRMEMLWDPETVFRRIDGSQVTLSQLTGKRLLILFESPAFNVSFETSKQVVKFLNFLKVRYINLRGSHDEFEVIHIIKTSKMESSASILVGAMPWLISQELPAVDIGSYLLDVGLFKFHGFCPSFAFGQDGRLVRRTIFSTFQDMDFPFCADGLVDETLSELNTCFDWNYWDNFPSKGRIYSLKDKLAQVNLMSPHGPF